MKDDPRACAECGVLLRDGEPARGLAHRFDPRPYCAACLRFRAPAPTPTQPTVLTFSRTIRRRPLPRSG